MRHAIFASAVLLLGCGARTDQGSTLNPDGKVVTDSPSIPGTTTSATFGPPLPAEVEAGEIPREVLLAVLEQGIPAFLRHVHVRAERDGERFLGWRVEQIAPPLAASLLRPGDVLRSVNHKPIARPEQFMELWDSLVAAPEILLEVERGENASWVRYRIADDKLVTTAKSHGRPSWRAP